MAERLRLRYLGGLALLACLFPGIARADERQVIGHSVQGRPIVLFTDSAPAPALKVLVVGDIHGNEAAGMRITERLIAGKPPSRTDLLVIPTINPDGVAAGTRGNAHGVDLNRNFPYRWRPLTGGEYSGPGPLSEPESQAAHRLILRERPDITIWFHQPFGLIDKPEGNPFAAHRFADLINLPLIRLPGPYPGSASRWQNHTFKNSTAFVAELPSQVNDALVERGAAAVRSLAIEVAGTRVDGHSEAVPANSK
ncbi:MAG TPA: M14 family zinc carboxypeptidase [Solirubrobacterales bacterium]|nr:M14 family zinc carboxypeptidase [Solirubrobacterales bacterium]